MRWFAMHIDREKSLATQYTVEAESETSVPYILRENINCDVGDMIVCIEPCFVPDVYLRYETVTDVVARIL